MFRVACRVIFRPLFASCHGLRCEPSQEKQPGLDMELLVADTRFILPQALNLNPLSQALSPHYTVTCSVLSGG